MDNTWYWRAGLVAAVAVLATYLLVPTYVYFFELPPETRNDAKTFEAAVPGWAPKKRVNLGLDLQGGIHLVMGVETRKAVQDKAGRRIDEVREQLERKDFKPTAITVAEGTRDVHAVFASEDEATRARAEAEDYFQDMYVVGSDATSFTLGFRDDTIKFLQDGAVDQAVKAIRNRVDKWGVAEPHIAKKGTDQILIQLPGFKDPEKAKELLGRTAQLEFKIADDDDQSLVNLKAQLPEGLELDFDRYEGPGGATVSSPFVKGKNRQQIEEFLKDKAPPERTYALQKIEERGKEPYYRTYLLHSKTALSGDYLTDARVALEQQGVTSGRPYVSLTFNRTGAEIFRRVTGENVKKRLAIVLDDTVDSAPVIQSEIAGGNAQITLGSLKPHQEIMEEAKALSIVLKAGALPAPVRIQEERSVGASLGPELIRTGSVAAGVGFLLVILFMAFYYRAAGLIANLALVLNALLILAALAFLGATLTLPGIAGIVLTLGMAVDANVLINERIREELRAGKTVRAAVEAGYGKAFWAIFDSNITTLIAAFVIRAYGSGPILGFATTLIIGVLASMFTAIVVTRVVFDWFVLRGRLQAA
jgi:preprotein translocase subunit SecD